MRHSILWLTACALAVASCTPRNCVSPNPSGPIMLPQKLAAGMIPADSVSTAPLIDGMPECEAR